MRGHVLIYKSSAPLIDFLLIFFFIIISISSCVQGQQQPAASGGNCWAQRAHKRNADVSAFVYECADNGNYKPVQCDSGTGYCFCVSEISGKIVPGSARPINHALDCAKSSPPGKDSNYRRRRPKESPKARGTRGDRCNPSQRISQINFLIGSFRSELDAEPSSSNAQPTRSRPQAWIPLGIQRTRRSATNPVEWKFRKLDADGDRRLSGDEFLPLVEFSREKMKLLTGCANSLMLYCDTNKDSAVDSGEFFYCFNTGNAVHLQNLLKNARRKNPKQPPQYSPSSSSHQSSSSLSDRPAFASVHPSIQLQNPESSEKSQNQSRLDCIATRTVMLESVKAKSEVGFSRQRSGGGGQPVKRNFIPKCTADGHYERIQCQDDLQLCWCVNQVTGQSIKTFVTNSTLPDPAQCSEGIFRKGCDQRRRSKFHTALRAVLAAQQLTCDSVFSSRIDRNGDGSIRAPEWKHFKKQYRVQINSRLRKCFRTEIAYCDQNGDERVDRAEWVACCNNEINNSKFKEEGGGRGRRPAAPALAFAGIQGGEGSRKVIDAYNAKRNKARLGSNPFVNILKP